MTEYQRQYDHYKAVRARLSANAVRQREDVPANKNKRVRVVMRLPTPEPVSAMYIAPSDITRRKYASLQARNFGFTLEQIIAGGRRRDFIKAKHLIIWEIKTRWPDTSWYEIARIVGLNDHSTCVSAFQKIQKMKDEGKL